MERYTRLRDRAVGQIKSILIFSKSIKDATSLCAIQPRFNDLCNHYQTFNDMELELHSFDNYASIQEKVDLAYYDARELLEQAILSRTEPFTGDYKLWPSFRDIFISAVDSNEKLTGVHKLQLLKSVLRGEAASLLRHITTTEENYQEAWKKLESRYNKTKSIVAELIQTFLDQRLCTRVNCKELRKLCDQSDEIIRALRALGSEHERRDPWLIHIILNKIDDDSRHMWAKTTINNQHPSFDQFLEFLNNRCDALESCAHDDTKSIQRPIPYRKSTNTFAVETSKINCFNCNGDHFLYKCPMFKNLNLKSRLEFVMSKGLCQNCLRKGHIATHCNFKTSCLICYQKHHSLLHSTNESHQRNHHVYIGSESITPLKSESNAADENTFNKTLNNTLHKTAHYYNNIPLPKASTSSGVSTSKCATNEFTTTYTTTQKISTNVKGLPTFMLLPTAIINVKSRSGEFQPARVLLDSGSQSCFITESCIQRLGLTRMKSNIEIYGLASVPAGTTKGKVSLVIKSRVNNLYTMHLTTHIVKNITSKLPSNDFNIPQAKLHGINLADPYFNRSRTIDILIGVEFFFEIIGMHQQKIPGLPILHDSKFGWLVAGEVKQQITDHNIISMPGYLIENEFNNDKTQDLLKRFWEIEEVPSETIQPNKTDECELFFEKTTEKMIDGRYQVRLPFKTTRMQLGESFNNAIRRLFTMEKRFATNPEFYKQYKQFIDEYQALGHMHEVKWSELPNDHNQKYFLPHHAVMKDSTTTKLRVVFDASCKTSNSISLNETLHVGPRIQHDLNTILLKFRTHHIAFVADIEKMYRQIHVHPDDKTYQLILWREDNKLKLYMLDTITYGLASSPYLAVRTLKAIADEYIYEYPVESTIIKNDFYVDDLLSGAESIEKALKLKENIMKILESRGLHLRKWRSNSIKFLESFTNSSVESIPKLLENEKSAKTLGILWDSQADVFTFEVNLKSSENWTKRKILSEVLRIYDPLGWLSPIIVLFKLFLQKLWIQRIDWDSSFPNQLKDEFESMYNRLTDVNKIKISRCYFIKQQPSNIQLHAFSDASEKGYGCVIYARCTYANGTINTLLVCAKSKVAPINQITLPRLELCAAFLMCKLVKYIKSEVFVDHEVKIYAWTDSMVVLHWLSDIPRRWKNFIANRTSKMLEIIPNMSWYHVPSKQNPADYISRGVQPDKLNDIQMWWKGPPWLIKDKSHWPNTTRQPTQLDVSILEARPIVLHNMLMTEQLNEICQLSGRVSSWFKLKRIVVIMLRFTRQSTDQRLKLCEPILVIELIRAEALIIRNVQHVSFRHEINAIRNKKQLEAKSRLLGLDPFIDNNGIMRVGGRLKHSQLKFSAKHPVILPPHRINELIIREMHISHLHAGLNLLLNSLRQRYWIINARQSVKKLIKECIVCIKNRATTAIQKMGDLPAYRVTEKRPFLNVGMDNAGPIYVKSGSTRNARIEKAYLTLFVCLSIKAVHIEVVSSMTSEAFLAALKRFVARRGIPENIYCYNGSNFIAANNELKILHRQLLQQYKTDDIITYCLNNHINFHFSPPTGAHFGGLWEASVKSAKYHMKRVMNNMNLSFEELTTLTAQIESVLNSRPLCCVTDDISELQILTPSHFLIGEALTAIPEPQLEDIKDSKLNRWQNIQKRIQGFWKSWRTDYLHTLQERTKWKIRCADFQIDDVVLLKDNNVPPNLWPFGIITRTHQGKDDIVRVVTVKSKNKEYVRPIVKLVKLPVK